MIEVELPDGSIAEFPDGTSTSVMQGALQKYSTKGKNQFDAPAAGVGEAALSMVTGGLAQPIAGLAGIGSALFNGAEAGGQATRDVMESMTYAPRTETGKRYTENVGNVLSKPIDWAGDAGEFLQGEEGRLAGRVATEAAMNFLPLGAVVKGVKGLRKAAPDTVPAAERVAALQPEPAVVAQAVDPHVWENKQLAERAAMDKREAAAPTNELKQQQLYEHADQMTQEHPSQITQGPGGWKVDENNIPIREDLSIDAKNAEAPLQRNLWGDELPRKHEQEAVPLTEAIDAMPDVPWRSNRDVGIEMLANGPIKGGRYGGQRGAVDLANNASGESKASLEAQNRLRQEGELGRSRYVIKSNGETVPLIGVDAVDYKARQGEVVVQSNVGKTPWTVLDYNGVKNPQAVLSRVSSRLSQRGAAPMINELADKLIKRMGGQVDSLTTKNMPLVESVPATDSMATPTAPETIAKKQELRKGVVASTVLKGIAPEYSSITTPQEAVFLAKDAIDIDTRKSGLGQHIAYGIGSARNATVSGINGMVNLHPNNPLLNFVRYRRQSASNESIKFSKDFVTAKDGFATLGKTLPEKDLIQGMQVLQEAARAGIDITKGNVKKLELSAPVENFILSVRRTMEELNYRRGDTMLSAGRDAAPTVPGYLPAVWTGAYRGVILSKDGKVLAVPQSDTKIGYSNAVNAILKEHPDALVKNEPRRGLNTLQRGNNLFNGYNDVLNILAKNDPNFAKLQQVAAQKVNETAQNMQGFNVHEMHKSGIRGAIGDRAHVSPERNAKELFKALIDFSEQAADYYSMHKALNEIGQAINHPDTGHLPNTKRYIEGYVKHITGEQLNPIGVASNAIIDLLPQMAGVSSKVPLKAARELKELTGLHMMSIWNPTFTALQWTQVITGALPELAQIGGKLDMRAEAMLSATTAPVTLSMLNLAKALGKKAPAHIPEHQAAAFKYMQDHGIMDMSELEAAQSATRNQTYDRVKKTAAWNISLGEKMTRPPVFMVFADIFHKFGLENNEAFMAAQHATNSAMGDYHPHERPQIYASLGVLGEFSGALTTYKHSTITQNVVRAKNIVRADKQGNHMYAPAIAALAGVALFQGISGMSGYEEMDLAFQWATGMMGNKQGLTETALKNVPDMAKHGWLSATTGLDFQSRASAARVTPELKAGSLSPQLSVLGDIGLKAYNYGKYKDEQSFNELMRSLTPSGLKGVPEDMLMTDDQGYVSNSKQELMPPEPRTDKERLIRKVFAIKPLRESIESKDVYIDASGVKQKEDALKDISKRYTQAVAAKDFKGAAHLQEMWDKREGPPGGITSGDALANQLKRMNQSQRQRVTGEINDLKSINRYYDMND